MDERLLAEINAAPHSRSPRLIYADQLEVWGESAAAQWWREESHQTETAIVSGHGNGDGNGDGYGNGNGNGYDGNGNGDGYGYGGDGDGDGDGNGNGNGDGYGYGYGGYGDGYSTLIRLEVLMEGLFVLVCENGFVTVGEVAPDPADHLRVLINNCGTVRRWGTSEGLGQLARSGPQRETVLDREGSGVSVLRSWIKKAIPCERSAWAGYLSEQSETKGRKR